jgi:hypothetical protein
MYGWEGLFSLRERPDESHFSTVPVSLCPLWTLWSREAALVKRQTLSQKRQQLLSRLRALVRAFLFIDPACSQRGLVVRLTDAREAVIRTDVSVGMLWPPGRPAILCITTHPIHHRPPRTVRAPTHPSTTTAHCVGTHPSITDHRTLCGHPRGAVCGASATSHSNHGCAITPTQSPHPLHHATSRGHFVRLLSCCPVCAGEP